MYVFSFTWCCQSLLCTFTHPHTFWVPITHYCPQCQLTFSVRFANLMVEKYCLVELISRVRNNVMLWNWVFNNNFIEIWFTCCKIYPFESVQFSGFPYIHKDLQPSLIPSFRRNPLFISSHSHFLECGAFSAKNAGKVRANWAELTTL